MKVEILELSNPNNEFFKALQAKAEATTCESNAIGHGETASTKDWIFRFNVIQCGTNMSWIFSAQSKKPVSRNLDFMHAPRMHARTESVQ